MDLYVRGDIEIPGSLVAALGNEQLVVFAGAGISVDSPSNLPLFEGLTNRIAERSGQPIAEDDERDPDRVLGDLAKSGVDVHGLVGDVLTEPNPQPNQWHRALASLWPDPDDVQIVTTNYDVLLEAAFAELHDRCAPVYAAPALPVATHFDGIVHLHGSLADRRSHLVVTDIDFSQAYLTEGWALRFVIPLFESAVVLFVGYSHNDTVMQYIARGLPADTKRYALTHQDQDTEWENLGITPVYYQTNGGDSHEAGVIALEDWGRRARMTHVQFKRELERMVKAGPPHADPLDDNLLREALSDPTRARLFSEEARGEAWLDWIVDLDQFRVLFDPDFVSGDAIPYIASWFSQQFMLEHAGRAMAVLADMGGRLHPHLWNSLVRELSYANDPDPEVRTRWIEILITTRSAGSDLDSLGILASKSTSVDDRAALLLLLKDLGKPSTTYAGGLLGTISVDVETRGAPHWLEDTYTNAIAPQLDDLAARLLPLAASILAEHDRVRAAHGMPSSSAVWRPRIESSATIGGSRGIDVYIEIVLDSATHLALERGSLNIAAQLLDYDAATLTRIAIWMIANDSDLPPDEGLTWLVDSGLLTDISVHHEVYTLIAQKFAGASDEMKLHLWDQAVEALNTDQDRDLLSRLGAWIAGFDPEFDPVTNYLEALRAADPDWEPSPHLDDLGPVWTEWTTSPALQQPDDLTHLKEIYETLMSSEDTWRIIDASAGWARGDPEWAIQLLESLEAADMPEVWRGLYTGLARATIETESIQLAVDAAQAEADPASLLEGFTTFALDQLRNESEFDEAEFRSIAGRLLELIERFVNSGGQVASGERSDRLTESLNSWPGRAAEFWVVLMSFTETRWNDPCETPLLRDFVLLVDEHRDTKWGRLAIAMLGRGFSYMLSQCGDIALDPAARWFDWEEDTAEYAWDGYAYSTATRESVNALDAYLPETAGRLDTFALQPREAMTWKLAQIAVQDERDPTEWLHRMVEESGDSTRARFAYAVSDGLKESPADIATQAWDRWIRNYWDDRRRGIPASLSGEEGLMMLRWLMYSPDMADRIPELIEDVPARADGTFRFAAALAESPLQAASPVAALHLLLPVVRDQQHGWGGDDIIDIGIAAIDAGAPPELIEELREQMIRLELDDTHLVS